MYDNEYNEEKYEYLIRKRNRHNNKKAKKNAMIMDGKATRNIPVIQYNRLQKMLSKLGEENNGRI